MKEVFARIVLLELNLMWSVRHRRRAGACQVVFKSDILRPMSQRRAAATLLGAVVFSTLTIFLVHYQQNQEREVGFCIITP